MTGEPVFFPRRIGIFRTMDRLSRRPEASVSGSTLLAGFIAGAAGTGVGGMTPVSKQAGQSSPDGWPSATRGHDVRGPSRIPFFYP